MRSGSIPLLDLDGKEGSTPSVAPDEYYGSTPYV